MEQFILADAVGRHPVQNIAERPQQDAPGDGMPVGAQAHAASDFDCGAVSAAGGPCLDGQNHAGLPDLCNMRMFR